MVTKAPNQELTDAINAAIAAQQAVLRLLLPLVRQGPYCWDCGQEAMSWGHYCLKCYRSWQAHDPLPRPEGMSTRAYKAANRHRAVWDHGFDPLMDDLSNIRNLGMKGIAEWMIVREAHERHQA